jgi:hypothetical protein
MTETTVSLLHSWQTLYVIIGSPARALTGLMFVVMVERIRRQSDAPHP